MKLSDTLRRGWTAARARTQRLASAHHASVSGAILLLLAGFGATAFGVAPMAPDAADLPKHLVTEFVTADPIPSQLDALEEGTLQLYRSELTRSSDTADSLLQRLGVNDPAASLFLRTDAQARQLLNGRAGKRVQVRTDAHGALSELVARYAAARPDQAQTHFTRLTLQRVPGGWRSSVETAALVAQVRLGSGTIRTSLFAATDEARLPDPIATQLTEVFAADIDFHRHLRRGDTFSVLYETLTADGEPVSWGAGATGRVVAAEFVNNGHAYSAVWFGDAGGSGGYFGLDGSSKKREFLASPLEFSRITSGFAMRLHPILNSWKQHKGVDYGAPLGTPIRAVGDGEVAFAGWQNGYGNVVEIRHNASTTTLYAHMSRIDVRRGAHVVQGQHLGAVGATGWATGPHLHFEVKVQGVQQDPLRMAQASQPVSLSASARTQFAALASRRQDQLAIAASLAPGHAGVE